MLRMVNGRMRAPSSPPGSGSLIKNQGAAFRRDVGGAGPDLLQVQSEEAAADRDNRPGHIAPLRRGEKRHDGGELIRLADPPGRDVELDLAPSDFFGGK